MWSSYFKEPFLNRCNNQEKLEKPDNVVFSNDYVDLDEINCDIVIFFSDNLGLVIETLIVLTLMMTILMKIIMKLLVRLIAWCNRYK